jgi:hypothetical protein
MLAVLIASVGASCRTERAKRPDSAPPWAGWTLADTGLGPIVVGMTPTEASAASGGSLQLPESPPTEGCAYASSPGIEGLSLMIENGRIVRIEVRTPGLKTAEGATVGDREDRIRELYAGRVTTSPHKYTAGHYLTVTPRRGSRGTTGLIFETDGRLVTEFRGGLLPQVAYVERCG